MAQGDGGQEPSAVAELADAAWTHVLTTEPYYALRTGAPVEHLPRGTLDEAAREAAVGTRILAGLNNLDLTHSTAADRDTAALLRHIAREWARAEDSWWWSFPVAPYQTYELSIYGQQVLRSFVFADGSDVDRFLSLVADTAGWVRTAQDKTAEQAGAGWGLPRPALPGFVAAVRGHRAAAEEWVRIDEARTRQLSAAQRGRLRDGLDRLVADELRAAFDDLLGYLAGPAEDTAVDEVGLGQYPGGEAAYRHLVRSSATFDIEPEEVHRLGLEQVGELTEQMAKVRAEAGFDGGEAEYRRFLEKDPRFHAVSAEDVASTYLRHIGAVEPVVGQWFSVLPRAPYGVERIDPALEPSLSYGMYEPPTPGNPTGRYRYNGSGLDTRSQINAAALILHELVPGHHFHLARQAEDARLHPIRAQFAPMMLPAYSEGWAEYAATLGFEMGVYDDPWDRYGAYQHQRFVAQRLVLDTGLNLLGWTLEKAREYMAATTMESAEQIRTETLRYSTDIPGQALGYRLGCLKLRELRDRAKTALAAGFDVRDFHEVVLGAGTLPLDAVEDNVDRFIAERSAR
ncbi:DUF885 domain-containing protein [Amycolatopsis silviterrae]|uniref:DUF885 domain-containing protein n=1 Tax=Amycolatopsis silviterrae TaxID=1656914 RepID=A0ABW5H791_9PSEU